MTATLAEVLAGVAREHTSHLGAGGIPSYWYGDCLATDCGWSGYGPGTMADAIHAHAAHVAAEQSRAVAEWLRSEDVREVAAMRIETKLPYSTHEARQKAAAAALDAVTAMASGDLL